jgi:hypothetical protein
MNIRSWRVSLPEAPPVAVLFAAVIPGYTQGMKTAISVPDEVFAQVNTTAAELGVSRSEFFTAAARLYLDKLNEQSITNQFNEALALAGDDDSNAVAAAYGRRRIAELTEDDEW